MNTPILLSALFTKFFNDHHAALSVRGHNDDALTVTIVHEDVFASVTDYTFTGNGESEEFTVQDCESIVILARRESQIVGCAVFEVNTGLIETLGMVLSPVSLVNVHLDQNEFCVMSKAMQRSLDAVFRTELPSVTEEAQVL